MLRLDLAGSERTLSVAALFGGGLAA